MRSIKTSRGNVFVTANKTQLMRLQKDSSWRAVDAVSVAIHAAGEQPSFDDVGKRKYDFIDLPCDVLAVGTAVCSEVEEKDDFAKALKLAFSRAVMNFSTDVSDRRALWKAFRKGV